MHACRAQRGLAPTELHSHGEFAPSPRSHPKPQRPFFFFFFPKKPVRKEQPRGSSATLEAWLDNRIGPLTWLPLESIGRRGEEKEGLANRGEEREINARRCVSRGRGGGLGSCKVEVLAVVVVAGDGWGVGRELEEY